MAVMFFAAANKPTHLTATLTIVSHTLREYETVYTAGCENGVSVCLSVCVSVCLVVRGVSVASSSHCVHCLV